MGDPREEDVFIGPMIDIEAAQRVQAWIDAALAGGARQLAGGPRNGAFIPATLLANVPHDGDLYRKEAFGPVACIEPFDDFDDALDRVNDSDFGLQAGVFTGSLSHAMRAWDRLEVGGVIIGDVPSFRVDNMPYGGVKGSGTGREGVAFAIDRSGALIGCVGYRATERTHAEMGYWIGKPYWGMGYATEAARALILHAFAKERFDYLTVGHFKENPASARVIAKLGFEPSGEVLRDCAARNNKARCLTYRLTRERALASLRPGQEAFPLSAAGRRLG
jgi:hypothetical protein